jgi:hypothetical protein
MANGTEKIADLLSAPMEAVIVALGVSIARAQQELDRHSMDTQREINEDPVLADIGLQAPWYQMPKVELELTMAIAMEERKTTTPASPAASASPASAASAAPRTLAAAAVLQKYPIKQLYLQPVNATYNNQFNFNVNASSKVKVTIMPVPPPGSETGVTPILTKEQVLKIADAALVKDKDARLTVNFNGQSKLWYVVQYKPEGDQTVRLALVVVDDETKAIVKQVKG